MILVHVSPLANQTLETISVYEIFPITIIRRQVLGNLNHLTEPRLA
jgi:hypothetical protein